MGYDFLFNFCIHSFLALCNIITVLTWYIPNGHDKWIRLQPKQLRRTHGSRPVRAVNVNQCFCNVVVVHSNNFHTQDLGIRLQIIMYIFSQNA